MPPVPSALFTRTPLHSLRIEGNPLTQEQLEKEDGYEEYAARASLWEQRNVDQRLGTGDLSLLVI